MVELSGVWNPKLSYRLIQKVRESHVRSIRIKQVAEVPPVSSSADQMLRETCVKDELMAKGQDAAG